MIIAIEVIAIVSALLLSVEWWVVALAVVGFEAIWTALRVFVQSSQKLEEYRRALQRSSKP